MSALDELIRELSDPSALAWNAETYDLAGASILSPDDRAIYVKQLMEKAEQGDTRAILTLGHIKATEAIPMLKAAEQSRVPWALTVRRALVLLGQGAEYVNTIANDALHAESKMDRVAAILDLSKVGGITGIMTMQQALSDADSAVRTIAWRELVKALDLEQHMVNPASGVLEKGSYLELLRDYLSSEVSAFVKMASDEIRAIVRRLAGGESPEDVGINYVGDPAPHVSDRIIEAIVDSDVGYPVEEIAKLSGMARRWSEAALALRAEEKDARVPAALARLRAFWTLPVLEELAQSETMPSAYRQQLANAVSELKSADANAN
jgi:hypothetical protein